jgi:hypothetical protein
LPAQELHGESYIGRMNREFAGYADLHPKPKRVTRTPTYRSDRDDWTWQWSQQGSDWHSIILTLDALPAVDFAAARARPRE